MAQFRMLAVLLLLPTQSIVAAEGGASVAETGSEAAAKAGSNYRQVVVNALGFLDGDGAKLEKGASCINCHHAPLRGWAFRESARLGVEVDDESLQETTSNELRKLEQLKDNYRDKQWGHTLSSFYMLSIGDDVQESFPQASIDNLAQIIMAEQSPDGSWHAARQFGNQRRPKRDANEVQTMWSVLALSRLESPSGAVAARNRGLEWLKSADRGTTIDSRTLRLIVEQRWGDPDQCVRLVKDLVASQHSDGGWGWQPDDPSEAWATGMALYALSFAGDRAPATGIAYAQEFLAKTQRENGSWVVEGKLTKNSEMSSYFGTVWAVVGLSRTLSAN
jgi:squalene-hopene/tetraprenyl-beta-curcumene cyclase